jgi:hypothetical protein
MYDDETRHWLDLSPKIGTFQKPDFTVSVSVKRGRLSEKGLASFELDDVKILRIKELRRNIANLR